LDPKQYKVVAPGVLSRSGLPSDKQFVRLKNKGVVGVTNLLPANEPGGKGDVTRLPSFDTLGFRYLWLPIPGSFAPTDAQAKRFLSFVTNPKNQPVHIFCKAGNARTGTMVALYRYAVDGWAMDKAIRESKKFGGGPSKKQLAWLRGWAATHAPRAR
ncbi:MAG: hypothetical protein WAW00_01160, partial [Candidatus Moraniibacteriota bacterium]